MKRGSELFRRLFGSGKLPILLLLLLVIPAVAWLGTVPYFAAHDSTTHRWRVWEFWQVWQQTGGLPRWAPDLHYGLGSPLFSLYSPLAYLFGAAAQAWGLPAYDSTKLVYALGLALAGTGAFALSAEINRDSPSRYWAGLLGSASYLYAPYILANVSIRGAIAEMLALGILPWLLFFELRALRQLGRASSLTEGLRVGRGSLIGLIISASGLILAHNLTALVASILAVFLAAFWLIGRRQVALAAGISALRLSLAPLLAAGAIALLLSAFYWLPVAAEYSFVHIERARGTALAEKYMNRFVEPSDLIQPRPIHDYRQDFTEALPHSRLGLVQVASFALAVSALLFTRQKRRGGAPLLIASIGAIGAVLLTLPISLPVWQALPILTILQFPWRLLGVASLLGAITVSGLATLGRLGRPLAIGLSLALMLGGMWVNVSPYDWRPEWESAANLRDFERQSQSFGLTGDEEFLPTSVQRDRWTLFDPESGANVASWTSRSDRPIAIQLVSSDLRRWSSEVETTEGSTLTLDSFHYPTLRARIDGVPVEARPEGDLGLLTIDLPPGRHLLEIGYEPSLVERAGDWLSGLTLVGIVGLAVASRLRSRKVGRRHLRTYASLAPLLLTAVNPADGTRKSSMHYADSSSGEATSPRLLGARIDPSRAGSTARVEVELTTFLSHVPDAAVLVVTRIVAENGTIVAEERHPLGGRIRPITIWRPMMILHDLYEIELKPGTKAGRYTLSVQIGDAPAADCGAFDLPEAPTTTPARLPDFVPWPSIRWGDGLILNWAKLESQPLDSSPVALALPADLSATQIVLADGKAIRLSGALAWTRLTEEPRSWLATVSVVDAQNNTQSELHIPVVFEPGHEEAKQMLDITLPPGRYRAKLSISETTTPLTGRTRQEPLREIKAADIWEGDLWPTPDAVARKAIAPSIQFGDGIELVGGERRITASAVELTTLWTARSTPRKAYTIYIHLLDSSGNLVGQYDGSPFDGALPTTDWRPGQVEPFAARLDLPGEGGPFALRVGLYGADDKVPLPTTEGANEIGFGLVDRLPPLSSPPLAFTNGVELIGHRLSETADGETLTLYWRATRPVGDDYTVFVHLLDGVGKMVAAADGLPERGERSTRRWPVGQTIVDPHPISRSNAPREGFLLSVGLYRPTDGVRATLVSGGDSVTFSAAEPDN